MKIAILTLFALGLFQLQAFPQQSSPPTKTDPPTNQPREMANMISTLSLDHGRHIWGGSSVR